MCSLVSRSLFNLWPIHFVAAYTGAYLSDSFIHHFPRPCLPSVTCSYFIPLVYVVGSEQAYF